MWPKPKRTTTWFSLLGTGVGEKNELEEKKELSAKIVSAWAPTILKGSSKKLAI